MPRESAVLLLLLINIKQIIELLLVFNYYFLPALLSRVLARCKSINLTLEVFSRDFLVAPASNGVEKVVVSMDSFHPEAMCGLCHETVD